mgnify:CR=1 FL=1
MLNYPSNLKHERIRTWVEEMAALCKPDAVYWCDGSQAEYDEMCSRLVKSCLLYTSDAAAERSRVDLGGRRLIKTKKKN